MSKRGASAKEGIGFGTFGGVFTPCTLTILGVIMFLRFGYVVGNAGLLHALGILLAAKAITVLTMMSMSAIATNTRIKGGGAYFLISRSLGVEFGGAIGVVFFVAQAISVAMYVIGFTEAFVALTGDVLPFKFIAVLTNVVVFVCVFIGAGWTIKVQYGILAALVASLISFFVGAVDSFAWATVQSNWSPAYVSGESLFTIFALFFPAVTGIMAGANMSGDLKNPGRSIPLGTLWAIFATACVYALMALVLAGTSTAGELSANNLIISDIAQWPLLITVGVFAATLSSALGSMMGAPRILQALARDSIFPSLSFLGTGSGPSGEPRRAIVCTFILSTLCILAADLNTIAPLITMAFMITYGTINLATFFETVTQNPSYRPTFRYCNWFTSLLGTIGCFGVMVLLNWQWALISMLLMGILIFVIYRKNVKSNWGDLSSGLLFQRTRRLLLQLERKLYHPKNWRPIILAMSGAGWHRSQLAMLGHWLTSGHGILNLGQVIQGDVEDRIDRIVNQEALLARFIREEQLDAFPNVVAAPTVREGIEYLVQCSGLGALRPNTLMLGWTGDPERVEAMAASLRSISALRRNIILSKYRADSSEEARVAPAGPIDVYWRGRENGELMLLLAHILRQHRAWRDRPIRLMRVVSDQAARTEVMNHLDELASLARIDAEADVLVGEHPGEMIRQHSADAAIVFLGFELPKEGDALHFYEQMETLTEGLERVLFVNSTGNMKLES